MSWDVVLTVAVGMFGLVAFGAAIRRRQRGANLLSVAFFVGVTLLAAVVTEARLEEYWRQQRHAAASGAEPSVPVAALPPLAASPPATAEAATSSAVLYGKTVADRNCAGCHRVSFDQPAPPPLIDATGARFAAPSFAAIAAKPETTAVSLRGFIALPHYPMPDRPSVPSGDLPYLTAYILSLRAEAAGRH